MARAARDRHELDPLAGVAEVRKARLAFDLLKIASEILDLLGEFEHIDQAWVHTHLYVVVPTVPPTDQLI